MMMASDYCPRCGGPHVSYVVHAPSTVPLSPETRRIYLSRIDALLMDRDWESGDEEVWNSKFSFPKLAYVYEHSDADPQDKARVDEIILDLTDARRAILRRDNARAYTDLWEAEVLTRQLPGSGNSADPVFDALDTLHRTRQSLEG